MKFLVYLALYLIYPFSFLVPRNKKKWAFGSFRGAFNGNSRYLFLYCSQHQTNANCVWLSLKKSTVQDVKRLGLDACHIATPRGIWMALTSKYWFFNSYTADIMFALSGGAICINLWHGVGLKRIEFNITSGKLAERYQKKNFLDVFYHPECFRRPDWVLSSTPFQTAMFSSAFRVPKSRCIELGYPRNHILTCDDKIRQDFIKRFETEATKRLVKIIESGGYKHVYVYMPTWRDSQRDVFTQSFDLPKLDSLLRNKNELMLLKPHANVLVDESEFKKLTNIRMVDGKADIYPVLPYTDVLITDYSSILYDYLLMEGKDVILYIYDYSSYIKDRDLFYPFDENVVGNKVYTFDELYRCIESGKFTIDPNDRKAIVEKFWGDTTQIDASKAICDMVKSGRFDSRL